MRVKKRIFAGAVNVGGLGKGPVAIAWQRTLGIEGLPRVRRIVIYAAMIMPPRKAAIADIMLHHHGYAAGTQYVATV